MASDSSWQGWDSYMPITWSWQAVFPDSYCPVMNFDTTADAAFHEFLCHTQAKYGYAADSPALCVTLEQCQKLCLEYDDCGGVEFDSGTTQEKCYLSTHECNEGEFKTEAGWDTYIRVPTPSPPASPALPPKPPSSPTSTLVMPSAAKSGWTEENLPRRV